MARIRNIPNPWGKQPRTNLQRSDLWQVDLSAVAQGIRETLGYCPEIPSYYSASVSLPELKVTSEPIRRDSRTYQMPAHDAPVEAARLVFRVDDGQGGSSNDRSVGTSTICLVLDYWRRLVRAGRGAVGTEPEIRLNTNYRVDYAFPVYLYLLRGYGDESQTVIAPDGFKQALEGGLYISGIYVMENAWLSAYKLSDLNYDSTGHLTVEATICCENLLRTSDLLYE